MEPKAPSLPWRMGGGPHLRDTDHVASVAFCCHFPPHVPGINKAPLESSWLHMGEGWGSTAGIQASSGILKGRCSLAHLIAALALTLSLMWLWQEGQRAGGGGHCFPIPKATTSDTACWVSGNSLVVAGQGGSGVCNCAPQIGRAERRMMGLEDVFRSEGPTRSQADSRMAILELAGTER